MAVSVVTYSAVATKLRAMYSQLLTEADYDMLMAKPRVADVFLWLRENTAYGDALQGLSESSVHRGEIERLFSRALFDDARRISLMLSQNEKKMLAGVMAKTDIQIIKRIIRSIHTGVPIDIGTVKSFYKDKSFATPFDLEAALSVKTYAELGEVLKPGPLYDVLEPYLTEPVQNTFEMENALDKYYFISLNKLAQRYLSGADRTNTRKFLAAEVDMHNLLRSYRYKKYYSYPGEKVISHLLPNKCKLKNTFWVKIAESDVKDFRELAMDTKYGAIFQSENDSTWYREMSQQIAEMFKRHFRNDTYNFTTVVAYIYLKEIDIQNLITIVEGVRYSLEPSEIRKYLVRIK